MNHFAPTIAFVVCSGIVSCQEEWMPFRGVSEGWIGYCYDTARSRGVLISSLEPDATGPGAVVVRESHGGGWIDSTSLTASPPARSRFAVAYDAARQQTVLFGGKPYGWNFFNTTELWTGAEWSTATPAVSPPGRFRHAMCYDAARQEVVLFGGESSGPLQDTWTWDGTNWTQRALSGPVPPARYHHAMAYDAVRQEVVLFGGDGPITPDTWVWNGQVWTQRLPANSPPILRYHAMAGDDSRGVVVMHGGSPGTPSGYPISGDTWEWDGQNWSLVSSGFPLVFHAMTYSQDSQQVILYGGKDVIQTATQNYQYTNRTTFSLDPLSGVWNAEIDGPPMEKGQHDIVVPVLNHVTGKVVIMGPRSGMVEWDPTTLAWSQPAIVQPSHRTPGMVFDFATGRIVAFGGSTSAPAGTTLWSETWEYGPFAGPGWSWQQAMVSGPSARFGHAMAADLVRGSVILFGGHDGAQALNDTWEWSGGVWTQLQPAMSPSPRYYVVMVPDFATNTILLNGGSAGPCMAPASAETWRWDGNAQTWTLIPPAPSGPAGRALHVMTYDFNGNIAMWGGYSHNCAPLPHWSDVWDWNGTGWSQRNVVNPLDHTGDIAGVYEPLSDRLLSLQPLRVLRRNPLTSMTQVGANCPGPSGVPTLTMDTPHLGAAHAEFTSRWLPSSVLVLGLSTTSQTVAFGACSVLSQATLTLASSNAFGVATVPMPISATASLRGFGFFGQTAAFDPSNGGPVASRIISLVIGD